MRRGPQPDDLRPERHRAVVGIAGGMVEFGENGHCGECLSWRRVVPFMGIGTRACHVRIAGFRQSRKGDLPKNEAPRRRAYGKVGGASSDSRGMTSTATSDVLAAGRENDAVDRGNIGIVAALREHDMIVADHDLVGRIEADPAVSGAAPDRNPGMRGVGAFQPFLARRRNGADIAADIGAPGGRRRAGPRS